MRKRRLFRSPRKLRFQREGKLFVAITMGIGLAAVNTGNNLLYLLLGWMLSVIIASGILSELSLRGLSVARLPPQRVYAGRPFLMGISLKNVKARLPSFSIEVEDLIAGKPLDKKCYFLKVPPGRVQTTSYRHTFARRGLYSFQGFRVSTKFPFALFRKSREVTFAGEIIVYPAVFPVQAPPTGADRGGEHARAKIGRRGEFFGLREFREGDDHRDVNWRATAHRGRLIVREYEEEAHRKVTVLLDNNLPEEASLGEMEAFEKAVSDAASLCTHYLDRNYALRLIARGTQVPSGSGATQLGRVLRALALLPAVPASTPFAGTPEAGSQSLLVTRRGQVPALGPQGIHGIEMG